MTTVRVRRLEFRRDLLVPNPCPTSCVRPTEMCCVRLTGRQRQLRFQSIGRALLLVPANVHFQRAKRWQEVGLCSADCARVAQGSQSSGSLTSRCTQQPPRTQISSGEILTEDKIDVDTFGSPPSYQIFLSILRVLCAEMCAPDTGSWGVFCVLHGRVN